MSQLAQSSKKQPRGKTFAPGTSGNPGGRAKRTPEELDLIKACRQKAPEALETILKLMKTGDKDSVRLNAATYVVDRGYGKAPQTLDINATVESYVISPEERALRIKELLGKTKK